MRPLKTLLSLLLLPAICQASPWDSHSFGGDKGLIAVGYWVLSVMAVVFFMTIHLANRSTSIQRRQDPTARVHKVRIVTRMLAIAATVLSVICWLRAWDEQDSQAKIMFGAGYLAIFISYFKGAAKRSSERNTNTPSQ